MMTQEPFKILPSEIIIYILSKLPPRTILICKCVCKSWHHLVDSQEFVKLHLSTSVPGLVTLKVGGRSGSINFFEIEDGHDVEHHDLHYNLATSFNIPHAQWLCGSVDGLLWLHDHTTTREADAICICNPITRDCIRIHTPLEFPSTKHQLAIYGFGSCRMSSQHKLVRILLDNICDKDSGYERRQSRSIAECHVYTLGSGCGWRRLAPCALNCVTPTARQHGAFLNGNLHWLGCDLNRCIWISCFDLETESFRTFAAAPPLHSASEPDMVELFAWGESLCLSDNTNEHDFVVWVMEEYRIVKSWTKKFVFNLKIHREYFAGNRLLKVFKSGDVLMEINFKLFYFSNKTKNLQQVDMFKGGYSAHFPHLENIKGVIHTPSLRSLKSFGMENVISV